MNENEMLEAEPEAVEPEAEIEAPEPETPEAEAGAEPEADSKRRDDDGKLKAIARERDRRRKAEREAETLRAQLAQRERGDLEAKVAALDPADFDTDEAYEAEREKLTAELSKASPAGDPGLAAASRELRAAIEDADPKLMAAVEKMPVLTAPMIEYAAEADDPAALLRYLVEHPEEAEAFAGRTPTRTVIALGKIEAKLASQPPKPGPRRTTEAPDPIDPVRSTREGRPDPSRFAKDDNVERYRAERERAMGKDANRPPNLSW